MDVPSADSSAEGLLRYFAKFQPWLRPKSRGTEAHLGAMRHRFVVDGRHEDAIQVVVSSKEKVRQQFPPDSYRDKALTGFVSFQCQRTFESGFSASPIVEKKRAVDLVITLV